MKTHFLLLASVLFFTAACHRKNSDSTSLGEGVSVKPCPAIDPGAFPLVAGHMWVYFGGDTLLVEGDTTINGMTATRITKKNLHFTHAMYCANRADGLYMIAATNMRDFGSLVVSAIDSPGALIVPDKPVQVTKLPIVQDTSWLENIPEEKNATGQWSGYYTVTTPYGTHNCAKLKGQGEDYYSAKGIVLEVDIVQCFVAPCPPIVGTYLVYTNF